MSKSERWQALFVCLALAAGTAALYAPSGHFAFVNYDDIEYVVTNFRVNQGLSWQNFLWSFNAGFEANWHPLTWLSLMFDRQFFGLRPGPMHLVNAAWHTANAVLLFLALRSLTRRLWPSALAAALFAWHPAHVESVAWITERKDVLSGFFFILTLWAYVAYAHRCDRQPKPALGFYAAALALFALGLMAKPMLVTTPFLLLLLDAWPLGRIDFGDDAVKKNGWAAARPLILEKLPFFALAAASCALTVVAQSRGGAVRNLRQSPVGDRLLNALASYARYTDELVWPRGLTASHPLANAPPPGAIALGAVLLAGLTALGIIAWSRRPYVLIGWLWFVGSLVPVIGVVQVGAEAYADRYTYLPSIGFFIMICWAGFDLAAARPNLRVALAGLALAAAAACVWLTISQVETWRDSVALWRRATSVDPANGTAHAAYASSLININDLAGARRQCEIALQIDPADPIVQEYMGDVLYLQGQYADAARFLEKSVRADPYQSEAHYHLSDVYLALHDPESAIAECRAALRIDPSEARAYFNWAKALAMENRLAEAIPQYQAAIRLFPAYPDALVGLAEAHSAQGDNRDAAQEYAAALQLQPGRLDVLNNLAWLLATAPQADARDGATAVTLAEAACKMTTNREPVFLGTLAAAYAKVGRYDDAVTAAQSAHDLALAQGNGAVAAKNLELQKLYRNHHAVGAP